MGVRQRPQWVAVFAIICATVLLWLAWRKRFDAQAHNGSLLHSPASLPVLALLGFPTYRRHQPCLLSSME
jgi:hypothetical protein